MLRGLGIHVISIIIYIYTIQLYWLAVTNKYFWRHSWLQHLSLWFSVLDLLAVRKHWISVRFSLLEPFSPKIFNYLMLCSIFQSTNIRITRLISNFINLFRAFFIFSFNIFMLAQVCYRPELGKDSCLLILCVLGH